jgi:DNA-binding SARP family transcriptional activator
MTVRRRSNPTFQVIFMLSLRTLGGLSIEGDHPPRTLPVPRRRLLAVLALIAGHDPPGISREKLMAFLWPESDPDHARKNLKQGLYSLRQSLGIPLVTSVSGVLRLDPRLIQVDLWSFEADLGRGNELGAVAAYPGPFLDGFHLSGLDEFEKWMGAERERLARRYRDALRALAERAQTRGEPLAAVAWWRRVMEAEPLCSTAALGFMRSLVAAGELTGSRQHGLAHATKVRAELGGPLAEAVVALAHQLRDDPPSLEPSPAARWPLLPARVGPGIGDSAHSTGRAGLPWHRAPSIPAVPGWVWWVVASFWAVGLLLNARVLSP